MSFLVVSFCASSPTQPIEKQHKVALLSCEEKMALITDVFLAALAITTAILIILSTKGVNLGQLSAIGSLGMKTAYVLIAVAGAVIIADITKLMVQMARHINRLFEINAQLASNAPVTKLSTALDEASAQVEEANKKIHALQEEKTRQISAHELLAKKIQDAELRAQEQQDLAALKEKQQHETGQRQLKEATEALELRIKQVKAELETRTKENAILQDNYNNALKNADGQLKNHIEQLHKENLELKAKEGILKNLQELQKQLTLKQEELKNLITQGLNPTREELNKLEQSILEQKQLAQRLAKDKESADKEFAALNENIVKLEKQLPGLKQQEQTLIESIKKAQENAQSIISKAEVDATQIRGTATKELEERRLEVSTQIKNYENQLRGLETKILDASKHATEKAQELSNIHEEIKKGTTQLNALKLEIENAGQSRTDILKETTTQNELLGKTLTEIERVKKEKTSLEEDYKLKKAEIEKLINDADQKAAQIIKDAEKRAQGLVEAKMPQEAQKILEQARADADETRRKAVEDAVKAVLEAQVEVARYQEERDAYVKEITGRGRELEEIKEEIEKNQKLLQSILESIDKTKTLKTQSTTIPPGFSFGSSSFGNNPIHQSNLTFSPPPQVVPKTQPEPSSLQPLSNTIPNPPTRPLTKQEQLSKMPVIISEETEDSDENYDEDDEDYYSGYYNHLNVPSYDSKNEGTDPATDFDPPQPHLDDKGLAFKETEQQPTLAGTNESKQPGSNLPQTSVDNIQPSGDFDDSSDTDQEKTTIPPNTPQPTAVNNPVLPKEPEQLPAGPNESQPPESNLLKTPTNNIPPPPPPPQFKKVEKNAQVNPPAPPPKETQTTTPQPQTLKTAAQDLLDLGDVFGKFNPPSNIDPLTQSIIISSSGTSPLSSGEAPKMPDDARASIKATLEGNPVARSHIKNAVGGFKDYLVSRLDTQFTPQTAERAKKLSEDLSASFRKIDDQQEVEKSYIAPVLTSVTGLTDLPKPLLTYFDSLYSYIKASSEGEYDERINLSMTRLTEDLESLIDEFANKRIKEREEQKALEEERINQQALQALNELTLKNDVLFKKAMEFELYINEKYSMYDLDFSCANGFSITLSGFNAKQTQVEEATGKKIEYLKNLTTEIKTSAEKISKMTDSTERNQTIPILSAYCEEMKKYLLEINSKVKLLKIADFFPKKK